MQRKGSIGFPRSDYHANYQLHHNLRSIIGIIIGSDYGNENTFRHKLGDIIYIPFIFQRCRGRKHSLLHKYQKMHPVKEVGQNTKKKFYWIWIMKTINYTIIKGTLLA